MENENKDKQQIKQNNITRMNDVLFLLYSLFLIIQCILLVNGINNWVIFSVTGMIIGIIFTNMAYHPVCKLADSLINLSMMKTRYIKELEKYKFLSNERIKQLEAKINHKKYGNTTKKTSK